jgi:hypothetical protein
MVVEVSMVKNPHHVSGWPLWLLTFETGAPYEVFAPDFATAAARAVAIAADQPQPARRIVSVTLAPNARLLTPEHQLAADLRAAIDDARASIATVPDGGTCCLDSVKLRVPRRSKAIEAACEAVGVSLERNYDGSYTVDPFATGIGQAGRLTKFCELVAGALRAKGHDANVSYVMD